MFTPVQLMAESLNFALVMTGPFQCRCEPMGLRMIATVSQRPSKIQVVIYAHAYWNGAAGGQCIGAGVAAVGAPLPHLTTTTARTAV
jgi:hypothetical protein